MPLSAAKPKLKIDIERMLKELEDLGQSGKTTPDEIRAKKAQMLADAIHAYVTAATVQTSNGTGAIIGASPAGPVTGTAVLVAAVGSLI